MSGPGVLPPLVVLPLACIAVLVVSAHLAAMAADREMPLSRRRIRTATGIVMLATILVLAYSFAYAPVGNPRRFTIAWSMSVMLLAVVLGLGGLDAINNVRLARLTRRRIGKAGRELERQIARAIAEHRSAGHRGAGRDDQPSFRLRDDSGDRPGPEA